MKRKIGIIGHIGNHNTTLGHAIAKKVAEATDSEATFRKPDEAVELREGYALSNPYRDIVKSLQPLGLSEKTKPTCERNHEYTPHYTRENNVTYCEWKCRFCGKPL